MEETVFWILFGISILGNLIEWLFIDNLLNQNRQLEKAIQDALKSNDRINDDVEKYHRVLEGLFDKAYTDIVRVDKNGSFSSDDEVGWTFQLIKNTVQDITQRLKDLRRTDGDKET
jgi:hypothetical protein